MTRTLLIACLLSLVATAGMAFALTRGERASAQVPVPAPVPSVPQRLVMRVGDTVRVEGALIGCQVTRRGRRPVIECRRDGDLAGTYGTFISDRSVTVGRFRSSRTAQTILTARHGGRWRACTETARPSRIAAAARGCR